MTFVLLLIIVCLSIYCFKQAQLLKQAEDTLWECRVEMNNARNTIRQMLGQPPLPPIKRN